MQRTQQQAYDLREQIVTDRVEARDMYNSDEEHSVLEDDSDGEEREEEYEDDDRSSELSIPNESIDFDLVYALHSFAATVEGQANVVKGDSLFLMDDSNSYWWLVRVLKTQEVGYIPAENIETPFERLARLNKHRNVDLASATQAEQAEGPKPSNPKGGSRAGFNIPSPSPPPGPPGQQARSDSRATNGGRRRSVFFTPALSVHRYPPAVWNEDEEEDEDIEWDDEGYEDEDPDIAEDFPREDDPRLAAMDPDDGMSWEDGAVEAMRQQQQQQQQQGGLPDALRVGGQVSPPLRLQSSREQLLSFPDGGPPSASPISPNGRQFDPAQVMETRKISATPTIARDGSPQSTLQQQQQQEQQRLLLLQQQQQQQQQQMQQQQQQPGPMLPSAVMQQQAEERKRTREEIEALEEAARKRNKGVLAPGLTPQKGVSPSSSISSDLRQQAASPSGGKLRKEQPVADDDKDKSGKKRGMLSGLFGRKKDKDKSKGGIESSDLRGSDDSGSRTSSQGHSMAGSREGLQSPVTEAAKQQQQTFRNSTNPRQAAAAALEAQIQQQEQQQQQQQAPQTPQQPGRMPAAGSSPQDSSPLSSHASTLRQRDQAQQQLYQQYLNRSPSSPPEAQPSYGLQSASRLGGTPYSSMTSSSSGGGLSASESGVRARPRPGSLVLSPSSDGPGVPDLSVIRVFAGKNVQTEATFKTVLLNSSTSSEELVRQAMQRFRLPAGDDAADYFLTVKQVEGSSAVLRPGEKPLGVFESLVEAALELPKVKRSSVGSISSVASNLSMHPAIKKLSMNDFTDDSAVKFYLNRRGADGADTSAEIGEGEDTMVAETTIGDVDNHSFSAGRNNMLVPPALNVPGAGSVGAERFSSPSARFALQVSIFPEDLPEDMVFDPQTEAIVFKHTLRDRPQGQTPASGVNQSSRRKVFMFPKNVTVAEVIELGLERFGILEGVVDGGDEVEDKLSKRQSSLRVRYSLAVRENGQDRELPPSGRVIEAYSRPPNFRVAEKKDSKRRSVDFAQLLGTMDDVGADDPMFVLKRAVAYRSSRNRSSAPLDDVALQHLRRDLAASEDRALSKQELIAAQRAASRANQRALLSAQANGVRGVDVRLPNNALLRSARASVDDRVRYSYFDGAGAQQDISDIVEAELGAGGARRDLLEGAVAQDAVDRVLSRIRPEPPLSARGSTSSVYSSSDERPAQGGFAAAQAAAMASPQMAASRALSPTGPASARSPTPTQQAQFRQKMASPVPVAGSRAAAPHGRTQSSASAKAGSRAASAARTRAPVPYIAPDDFGMSHMLALLQIPALLGRAPPLPALDPTEKMLFGRSMDMVADLHPDIRQIYKSTFDNLTAMDKILDDLFVSTVGTVE